MLSPAFVSQPKAIFVPSPAPGQGSPIGSAQGLGGGIRQHEVGKDGLSKASCFVLQGGDSLNAKERLQLLSGVLGSEIPTWAISLVFVSFHLSGLGTGLPWGLPGEVCCLGLAFPPPCL